MKIEAKLKELGLPIKVIQDLWDNDWVVSACGECSLRKKSGKPAIFKTEKKAYNWIAKEFKLDNLVSKDKLLGWVAKNRKIMGTNLGIIPSKLIKWLGGE